MDKRLFWGCGLGLRYYTGFGPLRMDVAFPLDKRENIDDSFQLYISIGQAF
jgi:translocation and assembly module TamA